MKKEDERKFWDSLKDISLINDVKPTAVELADFISEHIKGNEIIELGTGTGRIVHELALRFPKKHFTVLDISKNMLKLEKENRPKVENINSYLVNGREIPYKFAFLYSVTTLQHVDDEGLIVYLNEMREKMRTRGAILLQLVEGEEKTALSWQRSMKELKAMTKDFTLIDLGNHFFPNWKWILLK